MPSSSTARRTAADDAVQNYLDRLAAATSTLPPAERSELVQQITDHLAAARADARADGLPDDEALVLNLVEDLGTPEQVAAAAGAELAPHTPPSVGLEIATVSVLAFQWLVVPGLGWVVGIVMTFFSTRWTVGQKLLAAALPLPALLIALASLGTALAVPVSGRIDLVVRVLVGLALGTALTFVQARHLVRAAHRDTSHPH
ncbi:HAAS signaling domain-containing protein [Pseudokineococcus sp. 1T1Z-3]|uniref:HAAS signaling domain-containing protein n=1 Tax=Pseudokineococcus sp. 1T1Z-3 TaxID=3132745 RepID=UPI0030A1CD66